MTNTLVLLPGLDGTGTLFARFVAVLPPEIDARVIEYPADRVLSYSELLDHLRRRLPEGPFAVLGESFSGPLALMLASSESRVSAVILCGSFVTNPLPWIPRAAAALVFPFSLRLVPEVARSWALLGSYSTSQLRKSLSLAIDRVSSAVIAARVKSILYVDVRPELRECAPPIMYLAGEDDLIVRPHNLRAIRRIREDVTVISIPAPHLILQAAPDASAAAVTVFLRRVAPTNYR